MTFEEAEKAIVGLLSSSWTATPIAWQNIEGRNYTDPSRPLLPEGTVDYLDVRTSLVANRNITIPVGCIRTHAQLQAAVCVQPGTGVRNVRRLQGSLVVLLENAKISVTGVGYVRIGNLIGSAGYQSENGWFVEDTAFPFYFERHAAHS